MSSVQDIMECPQCKGIYSTDYNCRTQEEYRHCSRCGRTEKWTIVRDDEGKPVLDDEGRVKMEHKENFGFGSAKIAFKGGVSQLWSFSEAVNDNIKKAFLKASKEPNVNEDECYLSSWDAESGDIVMIYGDPPETYVEYMDSEAEETDSTGE